MQTTMPSVCQPRPRSRASSHTTKLSASSTDSPRSPEQA